MLTHRTDERVGSYSDPASDGFAFSGSAMTPSGGSVTPRQMQFLVLQAHGFSYKEAAVRLGITLFGVRDLQHRAYEKLGVTSMVEAFTVLGWLTPPALTIVPPREYAE